jgi:hypothetical protein
MQQRAGLQSKDTECSIDTVSLLVSTRVRTMSPWLMGAVRGRASEDAAVGAIRVSRLQPGAVVLLPVLGLVYAGELRWLRRCHLVTVGETSDVLACVCSLTAGSAAWRTQ